MDLNKIAELHKSMGVSGPLEEFEKGILVETEHTKKRGPENGKFANVPYTLEEVAMVAATHLSEIPNYYTLLTEMEKKGKSEKKASHNLKDELLREDNSCKPEFDSISDAIEDEMNPLRHEGAAEKDSKIKSKVLKVRETLGEFLAVVNNQIIPDSKKDPASFESWKNIREIIKDLAIHLDDVS